VKLPVIFGDHMVLQRDQKVPVWGTADEGDNIVWGTNLDLDNIVWGTSDEDNIVWGTAADIDAPWFSDDASGPLPNVAEEFGDIPATAVQ